jgi:tetratricopeptide (TPR) repeat protein
MPRFLSLVAILFAAPLASAQGSLADARKALLLGNYAEARESYELLLKNPKLLVPATVGASRAMQSEGDWEPALKIVENALKKTPADHALLARHAELLYLRGKWETAEKSARKAIEAKDDQFLARWIIGQIERDRGDWTKADEEFRWFIRTYSKRSDDDMEIVDPEELLYVGLAAVERARYHHLADQFEFVIQEVWGEAVKKDKLFWPAEHEIAKLFQEKYNKAAANRAFDRTLKINPRAAETLVSKGYAALDRLEIKDAENYVTQALKINPKLPEALRLMSDVQVFGGEMAAARKSLESARGINPRDEETLARIGALDLAERKDAEFAKIVKEVEAFNPKPAVFWAEVGGQLDSRKLYFDAEKMYRKAAELQPRLSAAKTGLGMLYMRLGKEDEARKNLDAAFAADAFNVRVSNTLKVLDHLANYKTLKTPHYIIRYDEKNDKILANFLAKRLEDIHKEFEAKFDFKPKEPYLIEVFNKHEMFSGRVVALPDLHTIGACTGRIVAMVSPRDKSRVIDKPFNWNRVMRHEIVHLFNLEQTEFRIPHWFTEGLAVSLEGDGNYPPRWNTLLVEKMQANELLNLDNILLGFARPRSPDEWQQAYMQSLLYVNFLVEKHGEKAVGKLLAAYAEGLETDSALKKATGETKAEFEKGYRAFLDARVAKLNPGNVAAGKAMTLKELREAHKKMPDDADVTAQLAEKLYRIGETKEARVLVDEALTAKRNHPLAAYVKALILIGEKESDFAFNVLDAAVKENPTDAKAIRLLGKLQFEKKNFAQAAEILEQGRKLQPNEPSWQVQLAKIYIQLDDKDKLADLLVDVVKHDPDDLQIRKKLAKIFEEKGNHAEMEKYALQGLEIDVLDAECQRMWLAALEAQGKIEALAEAKKILEKE